MCRSGWLSLTLGSLPEGGRPVAAPGSGRPLTEADLAYLDETHGLPPDLVADLLA
jgi:hypothetical protein